MVISTRRRSLFWKMKTSLLTPCCFFLLSFISRCFPQIYLASGQREKNCSVVKEEILEIHKYSPAQLNCAFLIEEAAYEYDYQAEDFQCIILDEDGNELYKQNNTYHYEYVEAATIATYDINSVTQSMNFIAKLIFDDTCLSAKIHINSKEPDEFLSCEDELETSFSAEKFAITQYMMCELVYSITCEEANGATLYQKNSTITWYRNCVQLNASQFISIDENEGKSTLKLAEFEIIPGNYSCMKTFNGTSRYVRHFKMEKQESDEQSFWDWKSASKVYYSKLGDKVTLECLGYGITGGSITWFKEGLSEPLCSVPSPLENNSLVAMGAHSCYLSIHKQKVNTNNDSKLRKCDFKLAYRYSAYLVIENVQQSELAQYRCTASTTHGQFSQEILLKPALEFQFAHILKVAVAVVTASLVGLLLCSLLIVFVFKTDVLFWWKKYGADYEKDDRQFVVYLSYAFDSGNVDNELRELLHKTNEWLESNEYSSFDQHRDNAGALHYQLVTQTISKCHRMLIFLSHSYFSSSMNLFDAQKGIMSSIEGTTSLIFVLLPDVQQYLKQGLEQKDPTCLSLCMAMKQKSNTKIMWENGKKQDKFFKQLEVAMPKLKLKNNAVDKINTSYFKLNDDEIVYKDRFKATTSSIKEL